MWFAQAGPTTPKLPAKPDQAPDQKPTTPMPTTPMTTTTTTTW